METGRAVGGREGDGVQGFGRVEGKLEDMDRSSVPVRYVRFIISCESYFPASNIDDELTAVIRICEVTVEHALRSKQTIQ